MKRFLPTLLIFYCRISSAQEMWGIANSNYAASSGMNLNPSSMMLMPYKWEVTLISADISLQNNYVAFERGKTENTAEGTPDPHRGVIDYYTPGYKNANEHLMLRIPSFNFKVKNMAFGFHTAVRNDLSVRNVPSQLAKFAYEGQAFTPLYGSNIDLSGIRAGEMAWAEIGFSAAKQLTKSPDHMWIAAATLKYIAGLEAVSLRVNSGALNIANDSSVNQRSIDADLNAALPESPGHLLAFPNHGAGLDIGVCYVSNSNHEHFENGQPVRIKKYDYRVGISLIDVGIVDFSSYTTSYHYNSDQMNDFKFDSVMSANQGLGRFAMSLPTALSVQYDWCVKPKVYFNLSGIQRIPMPIPHIDRANQLSATLRYETNYFEVALPYSLYDYYLHRIGLAVRYGIIYIGTDKAGTFIHNQEISGADFYFGLRLSNLDFAARSRTPRKPCPAYHVEE